MRKHPSRALFTGGAAATAAALVLTLSATSSSATTASTWTVKPGGKFSATNSGKITITDPRVEFEIHCKSSSLSGELRSGRGLPGAKIGSISAFAWGGCYGGFIGYTWNLRAGDFPYRLNAKSYDKANGETTAAVTHIVAAMSGGSCTFTIAGTTASTYGKIKVKYADSTHKLEILTSGSALHIYNVSSGCFGALNSGDHLTITGTYTVTPPQTITGP